MNDKKDPYVIRPVARPELDFAVDLAADEGWNPGLHDAVCGYGVIRNCRQGYKIGPLFADNGDIAEALFVSLSNHADPGAPVYLDVPAVNPAAVELARRHHMKKVFETARMYTGENPAIHTGGIFGVTTFELG